MTNRDAGPQDTEPGRGHDARSNRSRDDGPGVFEQVQDEPVLEISWSVGDQHGRWTPCVRFRSTPRYDDWFSRGLVFGVLWFKVQYQADDEIREARLTQVGLDVRDIICHS